MSVMASQMFVQPFVAQIKENIKAPHATGLCEENPPVTGWFPSQKVSNAENVSTRWRHHVADRTVQSVVPPLYDYIRRELYCLVSVAQQVCVTKWVYMLNVEIFC